MFFTFAANIHSSKKNKFNALPAFVHVLGTRPISGNVGTILNVSCVKASLTIEATLILPFFIFIFLSLIYFINILGLHTTLQIQLEETARKINTFAYITADSGMDFSDSKIISSEIIRNMFLTDDIKTLCNTLYIQNGEKGINFYNTKIDSTSQTIDIIITYDIKIPFIPENIIHIPFAQRCRFKLFTGSPLHIFSNDLSSTVYMTANGKVYHTNKYCSYLIKYSDAISRTFLPEYEKNTGRHFTLCNACKKTPFKDNISVIYISQTGTVYHYTRDCYYLTCHIFEYNLKDVEDTFKLCSRCSQH